MRLTVPSTSITAAVAASQVLAYFSSKAYVTAAVDMSYVHSDQLDVKQPASIGEECTFVKSPRLRGYEVDAGILGCDDSEYICVEDDRSSLGGRCARIAASRRELQTSNTPTCTSKCTGFQACEGLSASFIANNIAEGSCCGFRACAGVTGKFQFAVETYLALL